MGLITSFVSYIGVYELPDHNMKDLVIECLCNINVLESDKSYIIAQVSNMLVNLKLITHVLCSV